MFGCMSASSSYECFITLTSFMCGDQFDGGGHHRSCAAVPVQEHDPAGPWKGNGLMVPELLLD